MFRLYNSHHQAKVEHRLGTYNVCTSAHIICTVCRVIPLHRAVMSRMCTTQLRLGRTPRGVSQHRPRPLWPKVLLLFFPYTSRDNAANSPIATTFSVLLCVFSFAVWQIVTDEENTLSSASVWMLFISASHCTVTVRLTFNAVRSEWRKLSWGFQLHPYLTRSICSPL